MKITINDKQHETAEEATIASLVAELGFEKNGIAVAVDNRVIPCARWESCTLSENSSLIIIQAVSGG